MRRGSLLAKLTLKGIRSARAAPGRFVFRDKIHPPGIVTN